MPFEIGNGYGKRSRLFERALKKAVEEDRGSLERIAKELIAYCLCGKPEVALPAINIFANRMDGKPHQTVEKDISHTVNTGNASELTERLAAAAAARLRSSDTVQ